MPDRGLIAIGLVVALFAGGWWTGRELERGKQAEADLAGAETTLQYTAGAAKAQQAATFTLGEITRDATADPDAGTCALGLRDAQRLNRLR